MKVTSSLITFLVFVLVSPSAHAYLDPSTGSMIITAIVGLFASIVLAVKTYWYKLKAFFRGDRKSRSKPDTTHQLETRERTPKD